MIHYNLVCAGGHDFDGWFPSSAAFDVQSERGLLDCPICSSKQVRRAVMAPRLSLGARGPAQQAGQEAGAEEVPAKVGPAKVGPAKVGVTAGEVAMAALPPMPDQVRAVLQRIRAEIEQKCDYVGPRFAREARAMHDGAKEPRPIYGETTPAEAEALAEDGIEVARVPWIPRADS
jgi:hypothetical protein